MQSIKKIFNKFHRQITFLTGAAAVCLFFLAWCLSTISYEGTIYALLHLVLTLAAVCCYTMCLKMYSGYARLEIKETNQRKSDVLCPAACRKQSSMQKQLQLLNVSVIVVFSLVFVYDIRMQGFGSQRNLVYFILADIVWILCGIWNIRKLSYQIFTDVRNIFECIKKNVPFFILLVIVLLFAIEPGELQFRWDGALYEQSCRAMNIHSLSSLGAFGHLSQSYGALYCLLYALIGNVGVSMAVLNVLLYLGSIAAFYVLLRYMITGRHIAVYVAGAAVYAFSPFLLGMVNYYSLDYIKLCMFLWVVYLAFVKKWILHFAAALCFCFTKEPAVISYGAFCIGIILQEFISNSDKKPIRRITMLFKEYQHYLMALIACLWVIMYLMLAGWAGGEGEFFIDGNYIAAKLKVLFLLNFNWIMIAMLIIGSIILGFKKEKQKGLLSACLPLITTLIAACAFNIIFKTVNHARYAAEITAIIYVLAICTLCLAVPKIYAVICMSIVSVLLLISCYATIDPITLMGFQKINIGNQIIITTGSEMIGDSMIYNKQILWEEYVFNQALSYAIEQDYRIIIPAYEEYTCSFDGLMTEGSRQDGYYESVQYWDRLRNQRTAYENENTIPFILIQVAESDFSAEDVWNREGENCYIYAPYVGSEMAEKIMQEYSIVECREFEYRGWELKMLVF